jgi:hypothetical protein
VQFLGTVPRREFCFFQRHQCEMHAVAGVELRE